MINASDTASDRPQAIIVALANQKGGVGKSTTAINLAAALAFQGQRVLIVDLDPQGNATSGLGVDRSAITHSVYDVLLKDIPIEDAIEPTSVKNLFVVPATIDLAGAEIELVPAFSRERRLKAALATIAGDFRVIFIDCPPSLGLLTVNALTAADAVLIPLQCEYYALEGLTQLLATIDLVRDHLNPHVALDGVVLTMYDARTNLSSDVAAEARRHLGDTVYDTVIPRSVRLSEAPSHGLPITRYAPESRGGAAYERLAHEFRVRSGRERPSSTPTETQVRHAEMVMS